MRSNTTGQRMELKTTTCIPILEWTPRSTENRFSNFLPLCLQMTQNEARGGVMRLVAAGGRARETQDASAAVAIGTRTLSEAGSVGKWSREQVGFGRFWVGLFVLRFGVLGF
jgi:hypothetical protein